MKIQIVTLSYLLAGSGTSSGLIDSDISFHQSGFPFIPAKRIKGLLRESLMEVLEMKGLPNYSLIDKVFGNEGDANQNSGLIRVDNAYLENWSQVLLEVKGYSNIFNQENILNYFTSIIAQTTIDEKTGTAKKRSLRNYRVLNPGVTFETEIEFSSPLNNGEKLLFKNAVSNLRNMGTRRNRGFGKVKCNYTEPHVTDSSEDKGNNTLEFASGKEYSTIEVNAKSLEPLVLSNTDSDQNTVGSFPYISGSKLRGVLVKRYIEKYGKIQTNDSKFYDLFLSGNINFGNLTLQGVEALPLNLHHIKDKKNDLRDVFGVEMEEQIITKAEGGYGNIVNDGNSLKIDKVNPSFYSFFHLSRQNRTSGTSTADDGSIFYYSAIREKQLFKGKITGKTSSLEVLKDLLEDDFIAYVGKSKSAQYGKTLFYFKEGAINNTNTQLDTNFQLVLLSPTILINEFGVAEPSERVLKQYLESQLGVEIKIEKCAISRTTIEQFNVMWNSKTEKLYAFGAGSVFNISIENGDVVEKAKIENILRDGIGEQRNIGYGRIRIDDSEEKVFVRSEKNNSETPPSENEFNSNISILNDINRSILREKSIIEIKTQAIQDALNKQNPLRNNHLLGIMIQVFEDAQKSENGYKYIKNWLDKAGKISENEALAKKGKQKREAKPAYKSLEKAGLVVRHVNKINDIDKSNILTKYKDDFEDNFIYWTNYFRTMQKINKQNGN